MGTVIPANTQKKKDTSSNAHVRQIRTQGKKHECYFIHKYM